MRDLMKCFEKFYGMQVSMTKQSGDFLVALERRCQLRSTMFFFKLWNQSFNLSEADVYMVLIINPFFNWKKGQKQLPPSDLC